MNGTISIGGAERPIADATPSWINEQLGSRSDRGGNTCVRIAVHDGDVDIALTTRACGASPGGGRQPNPKEARILELWNQHHLSDAEYPRGQLIAFVQDFRRL